MTLDSIINTIYLTFAHNEYAIAFFIGALMSFISLLVKPSRRSTLLLISFTTLLLGFEYEKHIMEPLMEQTLQSLQVDGNSGRSGIFLVRAFQKLLPFGFFIIGWGSLFLAIFAPVFTLKSKRQQD